MTTLRVPLRVVIVGHGMVGARLVDELLRRDADGAVDVTVLGAEPYEPYNRVLLSDVVAGRTDVAAIGMPLVDDARARVLRGTAAVSVDRHAKVVLADDGTRHPYDRLVLATGSSARIPAVPGLDHLPAGVHALRTLDDAREIVAATVNAPRAVVVGGGVLGVEAAHGLAGRGLQVTLVHPGPAPMERQLDTEAGAVLSAGLRAAGVTVRTGVRPSEVLVVGGRAVGVRLEGDVREAGEVLGAGLVVLACGTVPETGLARDAGLAVDRGVVVGHDLTSVSDPAVHAVGDCAQPPEGSRGLVAEGWDQARRLAETLAALAADHSVSSGAAEDGEHSPGGPREHLRLPHDGQRPSMAVRLGTLLSSRAPTDHGIETRGTDVVKVKAGPLSVVSMGRAGQGRTPVPGERTVRLSDPDAGRYVEAVVAGGLLVGATCVGDPRVAADLTAAYTRRTPVPADPAFLLLTPVMPAAAPASSPEHMPDDATVCRCNGVTKHDIAACVRDGASTATEVAAATRATTGCGGCTEAVCGLVDWLTATRGDAEPAEPAEPATLTPL
ncbi:FAD-dependent oxidoreductase [Isoptericola variabilis]|uniref:Nitrite reductase (NAD(P)H) n=1 Tax=Isoptericola variabilis (strain 225) TaxID=743718 RepID=F6FQZ9_ISOV2|nr:FAD-dependent oxidoreductase [Isoptericola variabilis]AEG44949.1 Nitrite reductase (NAD(P)H) [Isoptericola variabilis 225]TWH26039.1 assimilatory nitrate reductase electron transfer subunit [Isoptericola variabilis J7]